MSESQNHGLESIKEFFKHINIRLSSPFIFSFIISWLIFNWHVTIGILFHDRELLKVDGYNSIIDLIQKDVTRVTGIWYPFLGALAYTIFSPVLSLLISAFQTYMQKRSDDWNLDILKDGSISIGKYLALREDLERRKLILEKAIEDESRLYEDLNEVRNDNYKLEQELNQEKEKFSKQDILFQRYTNRNLTPGMLQGTWSKVSFFGGELSHTQTIKIDGFGYSLIENNKPLYIANIRNYYYNEPQNVVFFVIVFLPQHRDKNRGRLTLVNELKYYSVEGSLEGEEDSEMKVKYTPVV